MILDGWGVNPDLYGNAVKTAKTPNLDRLQENYPTTKLVCSGKAVGLPEGIMGNSEVGHLNIGAGRIVYQDLIRIDMAIEDGSFFKNQAIKEVMDQVLKNGSSLHLMGLLSDGGVHSQLDHLVALIQMAKQEGVKNVFIHAILDGRDTPPESGLGYMRRLIGAMDRIGLGQVATICGRFYAMDRDTRWERTKEAYALYTMGRGVMFSDPLTAIQDAYSRGETDEFVKPIVISAPSGAPRAVISDGDGVVFFNFRSDRARQITRALTFQEFSFFDREKRPALCGYVCMTTYDEKFPLPVAFQPVALKEILGEVVSRQGFNQLRIAETEKYAHVTYFFNGGEEQPFPNEDRCLVPSPREVATYDQKPEMSAPQVTEEVLKRIDADRYDLIVLNFANMDMVGHTGVMEAAIQACETVDRCVGRIVDAVLKKRGALIITADHGNSEKMMDEKGDPFTAHTLNPVPLILVDESLKGRSLKEGKLGDIAPTILHIMGVEKPAAMTGESLLI